MMKKQWTDIPAPQPTFMVTAASAASPVPQPRCTVGLLTWNAGEDAIRALRSVMAQTETALDFIWIDNDSSDGTVDRTRQALAQLPPPTVNPRNIGFCGGHNQAVAVCRTRYYLALNQDIVLEPDYIRRLCDWLDEAPKLGLVGGLILAAHRGEKELRPNGRIYSAGLVYPRVRFPFQLGQNQPDDGRYRQRRFIGGVDGSAMMVRVDACRAVSFPEDEIFPKDFFAYGEEVDLAQRLARAGWLCGIDGQARALHRAFGSGGYQKLSIRARSYVNHWLLLLRHDGWPLLLQDSPYILRGLLQFWLPRYLRHPLALLLALWWFIPRILPARRFYHKFEKKHGHTKNNLKQNRELALVLLRESNLRGVFVAPE